MAKALPGPLVTAVSGTVGGVNFVSGKAGLTVRSVATRSGAVTSRQQSERALWGNASAAWYALTDSQRKAWATAAAGAAQTNSWGQSVKWSSWQYFHHFWVLRVLAGYEPPTEPLPMMSLPGGLRLLFQPFGVGDADLGFYPLGGLAGYRALVQVSRVWGPLPSAHSVTWRHVGWWDLLGGVVRFPAPQGTTPWTWSQGEWVRVRVRLMHADYAPGPVFESTAQAVGYGTNYAPAGDFEAAPASGVPSGWSVSSPMTCTRSTGVVDRYSDEVGHATLGTGDYFFRPASGVSWGLDARVCLSGYVFVSQGSLTELCWEHVPSGTLTHLGGPWNVGGWKRFYNAGWANVTGGVCRLCFRFTGAQSPIVKLDGLRVYRVDVV